MKNFLQLISMLLVGTFFHSSISAQWVVEPMPNQHIQFTAAVLGDLVYFGPGNSTTGFQSFVDVYNASTGEWEDILEVSMPRANAAGVAADGKVYFAGGLAQDWLDPIMLTTVDIYDTGAGEWTTAELTEGRSELSAVHVGDKLLFAGGISDIAFDFYTESIITTSDVVDIYDLATGVWSVANLSVPRVGIAAAVAGNYAVFAGGQTAMGEVTSAVDIYNAETDTWSTMELSEAKGWGAAAALGNKIYIAGGVIADLEVTDKVEILDVETMTWGSSQLSQPRGGMRTGVVGNKIYFAGGGVYNLVNYTWTPEIYKTVDIFDADENTWGSDELEGARINHAAVGVGNKFIVAGGVGGPIVWNKMEVFTDDTVLGTKEIDEAIEMSVSPNPAVDYFKIDLIGKVGNYSVQLYDMRGKLLHSTEAHGTVQVQVNNLPSGIYLVKVITDEGAIAKRVVKL